MRLLRGRQCAQRGFALLEFALAALLAMLLATWGVQALVNRMNDAQAQAAAVWMQAIHKAALAYIQRHGHDIQAAVGSDALAHHGYADWRAPTLTELVQAGLLSAGTPDSTRLTGAARVSVWHRGDCPGEACVIEALVFGERPLRHERSHVVDAAMTAQWLLAADGRGGAVHPRDPTRIRGPAFAFTSVLPDGRTLPVGTVGMAVTGDHHALWDFLRVRDQRDPQFQGDLSAAGHIRSNADVEAAGQLVVSTHHREGDECLTDNAIVHEVAGGLLVCRDGWWRSVSRTGGGAYAYNTLHGCRSADGVSTVNPITNYCGCPSYAQALPIFDSGPRPGTEGRQLAYLCVG